MVYFYQNAYTPHLKLDVDTLGLLRGHTVFEYLRTYQKKPFCLKAHLCRFLYSMKKLKIESPYTLEELSEITHKLVALEPGECGIKWYAMGGKSVDGLRYDGAPILFAFTHPYKEIPPHYYKEGIDTLSTREQRPVPDAKTTAYLPAVIALSDNSKAQEIIYLNSANELLEAGTSNLFLIKKGVLYTQASQILHGITREIVLKLAQTRYRICFDPIPYEALDEIDEAFLTATNKEILPIRKIDHLSFKIGPVTTDLMTQFKKFITHIDEDQFVPLLYENPLSKPSILLKS